MKLSTLVMLFLCLGLAACLAAKPSPQRVIIGKWANSAGGEINFYEDGSGFVPGIDREMPGNLPPFQFTYAFKDESHLAINMAGFPVTDLPITQPEELVIEVKIENDKMIWRDSTGKVEFVYTRVE